MTREEIIEGLKLLEDNMVYFDELLNDKGEYIDVHELLFEAIEVLEQEPCEDCISRKAVMNCYKKWQPYMATRMWDFEKELSNLPSITPKLKTDVLDKIRAEIDSYCSDNRDRNDGLYIAMKIIDKYKAESEDKE